MKVQHEIENELELLEKRNDFHAALDASDQELVDNRDQLLHAINMSQITKAKVMKKRMRANIRQHIQRNHYVF